MFTKVYSVSTKQLSTRVHLCFLGSTSISSQLLERSPFLCFTLFLLMALRFFYGDGDDDDDNGDAVTSGSAHNDRKRSGHY